MPHSNPDPVTTLKTAVSLRLGSLMAFPAGAVLLAILERGWLSIAALAAAMLAVSQFERARIGKALGVDIRANASSVTLGLAVRFGLLTGLFVVTLGILALFRDTALSRQLGLPDLAVIALSAGGALLANALSARLAAIETGTLRSGPGAPTCGGLVIEGEIIDRDPR